jgi:hypothetical protein
MPSSNFGHPKGPGHLILRVTLKGTTQLRTGSQLAKPPYRNVTIIFVLIVVEIPHSNQSDRTQPNLSQIRGSNQMVTPYEQLGHTTIRGSNISPP